MTRREMPTMRTRKRILSWVFGLGVLVSGGAAQAGTLSFDTGNVVCDEDTSIDVYLTNTSLQTIGAGSLQLGTFIGTSGSIAPGASVLVSLGSLTPWVCDDGGIGLRLTTPAKTYVMRGHRETTMVEIDFATLSNGLLQMHGAPAIQYETCEDQQGTFGATVWMSPPGVSGSKQYRMSEAGIGGVWKSFVATITPTYKELAFNFWQDECPREDTVISLEVKDGGNTITSMGDLRPYWELVTGATTIP